MSVTPPPKAIPKLFRFPCPVLGANRTLPIAAPPDAAAPGVGSFCLRFAARCQGCINVNTATGDRCLVACFADLLWQICHNRIEWLSYLPPLRCLGFHYIVMAVPVVCLITLSWGTSC